MLAEYTENLNLVKPEATDYYNVEDANSNMDIIDAEIQAINEDIENVSEAMKSMVNDTEFDSGINEIVENIDNLDDELGNTNDSGGTSSAGTVMAKLNAIITALNTLNSNITSVKTLIGNLATSRKYKKYSGSKACTANTTITLFSLNKPGKLLSLRLTNTLDFVNGTWNLIADGVVVYSGTKIAQGYNCDLYRGPKNSYSLGSSTSPNAAVNLDIEYHTLSLTLNPGSVSSTVGYAMEIAENV